MQEDKVYKATPEMEVPMVDPEVIRQVREFTRLKWGAKRIAAELGLARNTVRRYRRLPVELTPLQQRPGSRRLDATARSRAQQLLAEEAEGNAVVVRRLLVAEGQQASLRTVQRAVVLVRQKLRRQQVATVRFETAPGHQMQIDFGEKWVRMGDHKVKVYFFVAVLGYSRRIYVRPFLSQRHDDWREGVAGACRHFGGVPQQLLIDNPKAMVLLHDVCGRVTLHPAFEAFCKDWQLTARACAPYRARTKGKTESGVKYVKRNAVAGLSFTGFNALEAHLAAWMEQADGRKHGTTGVAPTERFMFEEAAALRALPPQSMPVRQRRLRRKVANDCLVNVDTIRYSVPHRFVGRSVDVAVADHEVYIYLGAECIAKHRRGNEPHARIVVPAHYDGLLRRREAQQELPPDVRPPTANDLMEMGRSLADYAVAVGGCNE